MDLIHLPTKLGAADDDGINNALHAVVHDAKSATDFAELLERNPRGVVRRLIVLNRYQNAAFGEMTDAEIMNLVKPVVVALRGPHSLTARLHLTERITTHSPMKISCTITIDTN